MKRASRSPRWTSPDHSTWQSLGEIALPAGFDPQQPDFSGLLPVVRALKLSANRRRQIEQTVCDAISNAWETLQRDSVKQPFVIRVFCQMHQQAGFFATTERSQPKRNQAASWGFFIITNLEADITSVDEQRTIDLFLYPEG